MLRKIGFAIDGGGTRSRLCLFDCKSGQILIQLCGSSSNMHAQDKDLILEKLYALLKEACAKSEIRASELSCGCIGSAGLGRQAEQEAFKDFFNKRLSCPIKFCSDGEILLVGSLENPEGYCLIAGTGSIALARASSGIIVRAGGLGHMLGDEGSASSIGWQAVKRALRSEEGRDVPTSLLKPLISAYGLKDKHDFISLFHHHFDKALVASTAPMVLEHASDGDSLAIDICKQAADELAALVISLINRMPLNEPSLALAGGLIANDNIVRQRLIENVSISAPKLNIVLAEGDALKGACTIASSLIKA